MCTFVQNQLPVSKRRIRILTAVSVLFICLLLAFVFRYNLMRGVGHWLIYEDDLTHVNTAFVLSGGPFDRGLEASKVYGKGLMDTVVCTGESIPQDLFALGMHYTEGQISKVMMTNNGVPDTRIKLVEKGTSTQEESEIILDYARQNGLDTVMVISTKFHTRRIKRVFKQKFKDAGIVVLIHGAPASAYDEEQWWASEYGLIALNNEYIKILYYWLKY